MLEISLIDKSFDGAPILKSISLEIAQGDFFSILGPSGCGKTTLLRIIAGLEAPDRGSLHWLGKNLVGTQIHQRPFNMIFQKYALFPNLTVADNIAFGPRVKGWGQAKIKSEVAEALKLVQLEGFADRAITSLSGGQQQRVAIARAIINKPEILLLDEPMSALDRKMREQMQMDLLRIQRSLGITFILVTHDQEEALTMSDKIAVMRQGVVEQCGTPQDIYCRPKSKFVADFIGSLNVFDQQGTSFAVRPEDLKISDQPFESKSGFSPGIEAIIREVLFKGAVTDIVLDSSNNHKNCMTMVSQVLSNDLYQVQVGQRVFVRWASTNQLPLNS